MYRKTAIGEVISDREELEKLLVGIGKSAIAKLEVDPRVPEFLKEELQRELEAENKRLAAELAANAKKSLQMGENEFFVIKQAEEEMKKSAKRFYGIIGKYDQEFRTYLLLQELERLGCEKYLYISEITDRTCSYCFSHHTQVYSVMDLAMKHLIPPVHFNCLCSLIAMDSESEACYNLDKRKFLEELEESSGIVNGGIFLLNPDFQSMGMSLTPMGIPEYPAIKGGTVKDRNHWYDGLRDWAGEFGSDAKEALDSTLAEALMRAKQSIQDPDGFLDWLMTCASSGIISDIGEAFKDPTVYSIANAVLYGGLDDLKAIFNPEDPASFKHIMDTISAIIKWSVVYNVVSKLGAEPKPEAGDLGAELTREDKPDFYVAPNGKVLPSEYSEWLGTSMRDYLMDSAEDLTLKKAIGEVYRPGSIIGDGGTADIIKFEQATGVFLSRSGHIKKGIDMSKHFRKLIDSGKLSPNDMKIAQEILENLESSLGGK